METIAIRNRKGLGLSVSAYPSETPGLVVHRTQLIDSAGRQFSAKSGYFAGAWTITHAPSGMMARKARTKADALRIAKAMGALGDWSGDVTSLLLSDRSLGEKVRALS